MTTIGFIRHGVTAWNKEGRSQGNTDIPLDEEGIRMAEQIAMRLEREQWDVIYTSPLIRAEKTGELIAKRKSPIELFLDNRLRESGGGKAEGTTEAERIEKWGESWRDVDMDAEPEAEVIARGMAFIEDIKARHPNDKVLVVSHGSFIRTLLKELVEDEEIERSKVGNTSLTIVKLGERENDCTLFNCMAHLNVKEL